MELKLEGFGKNKSACLFGYDMFSKLNAVYAVGYTSCNTKIDLKRLEDKLISEMGEEQAREFVRKMHEKLKIVDAILKDKRNTLIHKDGKEQQAAQEFFDKLYRIRRKNFVAEIDYILELIGKENEN